jgi:hypothetical protein
VESWIRPATPIELPQPLRDIMGWGRDLCDKAAPPAYPCLLDERHIVAQLYNMTNVPMAVWIDERGQIVRPAEPAGASDGFRKMDRTTFSMPADLAERGRATRMLYVDAVRDWVKNGEASPYALSPEQVRARMHLRRAKPWPTRISASDNISCRRVTMRKHSNISTSRKSSVRRVGTLSGRHLRTWPLGTRRGRIFSRLSMPWAIARITRRCSLSQNPARHASW